MMGNWDSIRVKERSRGSVTVWIYISVKVLFLTARDFALPLGTDRDQCVAKNRHPTRCQLPLPKRPFSTPTMLDQTPPPPPPERSLLPSSFLRSTGEGDVGVPTPVEISRTLQVKKSQVHIHHLKGDKTELENPATIYTYLQFSS